MADGGCADSVAVSKSHVHFIKARTPQKHERGIEATVGNEHMVAPCTTGASCSTCAAADCNPRRGSGNDADLDLPASPRRLLIQHPYPPRPPRAALTPEPANHRHAPSSGPSQPVFRPNPPPLARGRKRLEQAIPGPFPQFRVNLRPNLPPSAYIARNTRRSPAHLNRRPTRLVLPAREDPVQASIR